MPRAVERYTQAQIVALRAAVRSACLSEYERFYGAPWSEAPNERTGQYHLGPFVLPAPPGESDPNVLFEAQAANLFNFFYSYYHWIKELLDSSPGLKGGTSAKRLRVLREKIGPAMDRILETGSADTIAAFKLRFSVKPEVLKLYPNGDPEIHLTHEKATWLQEKFNRAFIAKYLRDPKWNPRKPGHIATNREMAVMSLLSGNWPEALASPRNGWSVADIRRAEERSMGAAAARLRPSLRKAD